MPESEAGQKPRLNLNNTQSLTLLQIHFFTPSYCMRSLRKLGNFYRPIFNQLDLEILPVSPITSSNSQPNYKMTTMVPGIHIEEHIAEPSHPRRVS